MKKIKFGFVTLCLVGAVLLIFAWKQPEAGYHLSYRPHVDATEVFVAGEFNDWSLLPMPKDADSTATVVLDLEPGTYAYKFVVAGTGWMIDPTAEIHKWVGGERNGAFTIPEFSPWERVKRFFTFAQLRNDPVWYYDDWHSRMSLQHEINALLEKGRFDTLEAIAREWRETDPEFISGIPKLWLYYEIFKCADNCSNKEAHNRERFARLDRWREAYPESSVEPVARAKALTGMAWHARGSGWASEVTPQGWKEFREFIKAAREELINAPEASRDDVLWHLYAFITDERSGEDLDWSEVVTRMEGRAFNTLPIIFSYAFFNLPRWGGAPGEWQTFARSFVEEGRHDIFARIVWSTVDSWGNRYRVFSRHGIQWPELKEGFEAIVRRHPESYRNINQFAVYACLADDRETAAELFRKLDTGPGGDDNQWGSQYAEWRAWALEGGERPKIPTAEGYESL